MIEKEYSEYEKVFAQVDIEEIKSTEAEGTFAELKKMLDLFRESAYYQEWKDYIESGTMPADDAVVCFPLRKDEEENQLRTEEKPQPEEEEEEEKQLPTAEEVRDEIGAVSCLMSGSAANALV